MKTDIEKPDFWMAAALRLAERAEQAGEVPVGAVVVLDNQIIGEGWNQPISSHDPSAHAEIIALRAAAATLGNYRLTGADLYVTIEPCSMCAGAIVHARIQRLFYGAAEPKAGVVHSQAEFFSQPWVNHSVDCISGVLADSCQLKISEFFQRRRRENKLKK